MVRASCLKPNLPSLWREPANQIGSSLTADTKNRLWGGSFWQAGRSRDMNMYAPPPVYMLCALPI